MPVKGFLTLLFAASLAGCSHTPQKNRMVECLTDPKNDVMYCDGVVKPWAEMGGYVCHALEDHEAYMQGCQ